MKNRKAFNFYRSYYDVVVELPDEQKVKFLMAILNKQFLDVEPQIDGIVGLLYKSQKHSIDKQVDGYKSKMKIKTPTQGPTEGPYLDPTEGPTLQEEEKGEEKEKGQVKGEEYVKNKVEEQEYNNLQDKKMQQGWNSLSCKESARYHDLKNVYGN